MSTADSTGIPVAVQPEYQIRNIPGFPGYRVDTLGQVWSNRQYRRKGQDDATAPYRPLKQMSNRFDYIFVELRRDGHGYNIFVHRLVLMTFVGPRPDGQECRHLNGDRTDNRLTNLVWGTRIENMQDRKRHGTDDAGERGTRAKLTNDQVREIRRRYAAGGVTQTALAAEYGLSRPGMTNIVLGHTYTEAGGLISKAGTHRVVTDDQVREIRALLAQPGARYKTIATKYGVRRSVIGKICRGEIYREVT